MKRRCFLLLALSIFAAGPMALFSAPASFGQSAAPTDFSKATTSEKLSQLDQRVDAGERGTGADDAGPGLALFYVGLVHRKNTLAIMLQSFALMALITVMWALVGYSLCFGGNGPVIGGFEHALLRGVGAEPNADYAGTIPQTIV
jgi:ammonium transporter, Amt family